MIDESRLLRCPECHEVIDVEGFDGGICIKCSSCSEKYTIENAKYYRKGFLKGEGERDKWGHEIRVLEGRNQALYMAINEYKLTNKKLEDDNMTLSKKVLDLKNNDSYLYKVGIMKEIERLNVKLAELVAENMKNVITKNELADKLVMMKGNFCKESARLRRDNIALKKEVSYSERAEYEEKISKLKDENLEWRKRVDSQAEDLVKRKCEIAELTIALKETFVVSRLKSKISDLEIELGGAKSDVYELKKQVKRIFGE